MNAQTTNLDLEVNIRNSTFETNSSSMHTVVISNNNIYFDAKDEISQYIEKNKGRTVVHNGKLYIPLPDVDKYFGRGFYIFDHWLEKLAYLMSSIIDTKINREIVSLLNEFSDIEIGGFIGDVADYYSEEILEGINNPLKGDLLNSYTIGYSTESIFESIDHQSLENMENCIKALGEDLKIKSMRDRLYEILFSKKLLIVEDSDESCYLESFLLDNTINSSQLKYILSYMGDYDDTTYKFIDVDAYLERS